MNDPVRCSNAAHPIGAWHVASALPASWQRVERLRQWARRLRWGCGCAR